MLREEDRLSVGGLYAVQERLVSQVAVDEGRHAPQLGHAQPAPDELGAVGHEHADHVAAPETQALLHHARYLVGAGRHLRARVGRDDELGCTVTPMQITND